jgi:ribosomal protein S18 acetylase RimI-like enzyme
VVTIEPCREGDLEAVARLVAVQQGRPERHVGYLDTDAAAIAEGLSSLEPDGLAGTLLAVDDGEVVGVLGTDRDDRPLRVWWHGPFVADGADFDAVADRLYASARDRLPEDLTEEELAPDDRNVELARFAERHGFRPEAASAVLTRDLDPPIAAPVPTGTVIRAWTAADRPAVAALHDQLFAEAHSPGDRLDEGARGRFVQVAADASGEVIGYAVAEPQADGDGYLDFLGVDPSREGAGVGAALIAAVAEALRDLGCDRVHLTVRATKTRARRLYVHLGFAEERVLQPWRKGFSLP